MTDSKTNNPGVTVIGGGLAGSEAAYQLARRGINVTLFEQKPHTKSPAHSDHNLAELVCSNSLRSNEFATGPGLLKEELRRVGSLLIKVAEQNAVPAGGALAVDREAFALSVTEIINKNPLINVVREEVQTIPEEGIVICATGPLTSEALSADLSRIVGQEHLYFYDAIAPIVDGDTINFNKVFSASRYDKGSPDDYINCPLNRDQYDELIDAILEARKIPLRDFEKPRFFEGCLPLEVLAARGHQTLSFGAFKPVGLTDPATGKRPSAVVQLRKENREGTAYNLVGCQTRLARPEQRRIFRMIPGLEAVQFLRLGSVHRNTFLNGPACLMPDFSLKSRPDLIFGGQISGVEGYIESIASGFLAGLKAFYLVKGADFSVPPVETALGGLVRHISGEFCSPQKFQPSNIHFGLLPPGPRKTPKKEKRLIVANRAIKALAVWQEKYSLI